MAKHTNTKTSATIGLYVETRRDNGYISFDAYPVWIGLRPSELARIDRGDDHQALADISPERITNIGGWQDGDTLINGMYLNHLKITSQGNDDSRTGEHVLYAFDYSYRDVFAIDQATAEMMARTLALIRKDLDRLYAKYGNVETFGAYVLRIADAIGASRIVVNRTAGESSYGRREHRIMELASGGSYVDGLVRAWAESFTVKATA